MADCVLCSRLSNCLISLPSMTALRVAQKLLQRWDRFVFLLSSSTRPDNFSWSCLADSSISPSTDAWVLLEPSCTIVSCAAVRSSPRCWRFWETRRRFSTSAVLPVGEAWISLAVDMNELVKVTNCTMAAARPTEDNGSIVTMDMTRPGYRFCVLSRRYSPLASKKHN